MILQVPRAELRKPLACIGIAMPTGAGLDLPRVSALDSFSHSPSSSLSLSLSILPFYLSLSLFLVVVFLPLSLSLSLSCSIHPLIASSIYRRSAPGRRPVEKPGPQRPANPSSARRAALRLAQGAPRLGLRHGTRGFHVLSELLGPCGAQAMDGDPIQRTRTLKNKLTDRGENTMGRQEAAILGKQKAA